MVGKEENKDFQILIPNRYEEMSQRIKFLPWKHEDRILDPEHPCNNWVAIVATSNSTGHKTDA